VPIEELSDVVVRLHASLTVRAGFSRTAAATLTRLVGAPPTRLTDLAVAEGVSQPSMSALVARLVDQGLLRRDPDPRDARAVLLTLTPAGEDVVVRRRADRAGRLTRALADLPPGDVALLDDALPALSRLADALRRLPNLVEVTR
jgi:DNA-binding MarR family transcriptional regulator